VLRRVLSRLQSPFQVEKKRKEEEEEEEEEGESLLHKQWERFLL
jgi:hypothetical protein